MEIPVSLERAKWALSEAETFVSAIQQLLGGFAVPPTP